MSYPPNTAREVDGQYVSSYQQAVCARCGSRVGFLLVVIIDGQRHNLCQSCAEEVDNSHDVE